MPEGDTIHRAANRLRAALVGREIKALTMRDQPNIPNLVGCQISSVTAKGKHLIMSFTGGWALRTHMRMTGSWHLYRPGERWQRPKAQAKLVLTTNEWVAVGFNVPEAELTRSSFRDAVGHLGPDLTEPDPDIDAAVARFRSQLDPRTEIGVALLDQRLACGVGNVYKSEVMWAHRVHPFSVVDDLSDSLLRTMLETASRLLTANLTTTTRTTVPGGVAVYGKEGRPCQRCGDQVARRRQGDHARSTYWCPTCQPPPHQRAPR